MYQLALSVKFKKELEKEVKGNLVLWKKVNKTLKLLQKDLKHPSLKLHKLSGVNKWSVSITKSYRLIFVIEGDQFICLEFGKHEDIY